MSAKKNGQKPSVKPSERKKQPQPHGGALVPGAGGGPQPGSGRPPSAIRAAARVHLDKRLSLLGFFAGNAKVKHGDRIRAIEALAKIGLEASIAVADVRHALLETAKEIHAFPALTLEQANELIARIEQHWLRL